VNWFVPPAAIRRSFIMDQEMLPLVGTFCELENSWLETRLAEKSRELLATNARE